MPVYTIKADSVVFANGDSIFYLNRVACENCTTIVNGPANCDTCYGKYNQAQFLQKIMTVSANGVITFSDTNELVIQTQSTLNDTWQFSTTPAITAEVILLSIIDVFGNIDSAKTIILSSGDTIILSKNYGLLQFPFSYGSGQHYYLTGIETQQLGFIPPKMKDFFNFDVADMFEYRGGSGNGGLFQSTDFVRKYQVISKSQNGDTLIYHIQGNERIFIEDHQTYSMHYNIIDRDLIFIDSSSHFGNNYASQFIDLDSIILSWSGSGVVAFYSEGLGTKFYDITKTELDSLGLFTKYFGMSPPYNQPLFGMNTVDTMINVCYRPFFWGEELDMAYKEGLGQISFGYQFFEWGIGEHLVAYRKGIDTVGIFTPDSDLIAPPPTCANFAVTPSITAIPSQYFCFGDSITLEAEPGFDSYLWSTGETTQSIVVDAEIFYSVSVLVNDTCWFSSNVIWPQEDISPPVITIDSVDIYCGGYYSYQWFLNGDSIPGATERHYCPILSGNYTVAVTGLFGCVETSTIVEINLSLGNNFACLSGMEENNNLQVTIFPNPATTEITIQGYTPASMKLCNTLGQTVAEASNTNKLWLGNLPQGLYLLQLFDEKGALVKTEKVVRE